MQHKHDYAKKGKHGIHYGGNIPRRGTKEQNKITTMERHSAQYPNLWDPNAWSRREWQRKHRLFYLLLSTPDTSHLMVQKTRKTQRAKLHISKRQPASTSWIQKLRLKHALAQTRMSWNIHSPTTPMMINTRKIRHDEVAIAKKYAKSPHTPNNEWPKRDGGTLRGTFRWLFPWNRKRHYYVK